MLSREQEYDVFFFTNYSKALQKNHGADLPIKHVFSAEIVPYKQAYIERNFHPEIIFRDILELATGPEAYVHCPLS